jgi:hypothetical protein
MAKPKSKSGYIVGHYIKLPLASNHSPFKSEAFRQVSNNAKLIYHFIHYGYDGFNNGSLTAGYESFKRLYGLSISKATFYRSVKELMDYDLLFRIVKGKKGIASRYAVATYPIDDVDDLKYSTEYKKGSKPITKYLRHETEP